MVAQIDIQAKVNGKLVPRSRMGDPFDLAAFPGAVDASKGRSLEKLGKDIAVVTKMLANGDPDIENISVDYTVENGKLIITTDQKSLVGVGELGEVYDGGPKLYVFKAAMSVLHGHNYSQRSGLNDISYDIMKTWRQKRLIGGGATIISGNSRNSGSFNGMNGMLATGFSLMGIG
jgi:hypothetical protein